MKSVINDVLSTADRSTIVTAWLDDVEYEESHGYVYVLEVDGEYDYYNHPPPEEFECEFFYVGQTGDIEQRLKDHITMCRTGNWPNRRQNTDIVHTHSAIIRGSDKPHEVSLCNPQVVGVKTVVGIDSHYFEDGSDFNDLLNMKEEFMIKHLQKDGKYVVQVN